MNCCLIGAAEAPSRVIVLPSSVRKRKVRSEFRPNGIWRVIGVCFCEDSSSWFQSDCGCKVMDMVSNTQVGTRVLLFGGNWAVYFPLALFRVVTGVFPLRLVPSSACRSNSSKADRRSTDVCYAFRIPRYIGFTFSIDHVVVVVVVLFLFCFLQNTLVELGAVSCFRRSRRMPWAPQATRGPQNPLVAPKLHVPPLLRRIKKSLFIRSYLMCLLHPVFA